MTKTSILRPTSGLILEVPTIPAAPGDFDLAFRDHLGTTLRSLGFSQGLSSSTQMSSPSPTALSTCPAL